MTIDFPCGGPATAEGLCSLGGQVANARGDILTGQANIRGDLLTADAATRGSLLSAGSANTQSILTDANGNATTILQKTCADTASIVGAVERANYAGMSQTDKYGLANLNTTRAESDRVGSAIDRASYGLSHDVHGESDKITGQASTIAWSQNESEGRRFGEVRAQIERVNDAQSAYSDRAFKFLSGSVSDSFARLSSQGENGFYRTGVAIDRVDRDVLKSECSVKEAIAAAQAAAAECCCEVKQEVIRTGKELGLQAAQNFGAVQLEAAKNKADLQLQAAVNQKDSFLEQGKWFALAEKTAMVNKCELADKLAACCCEIKEAVAGTAQATQALIRDTEASRVRDALSAATTENAILRLRREEHHHYPYHPYHPHHDDRRGSRG